MYDINSPDQIADLCRVLKIFADAPDVRKAVIEFARGNIA